MTKKDEAFPLPEVRFLVARNWRARFGLGFIILLAIYLLSAVVSLSQSNERLNKRNNELVKNAADASIQEAKKTAELLSIISKLDGQITILGGVTPAPIKEQLKDVLEEDGSNGSGEPASENGPTYNIQPVLPLPTTTTMEEGPDTTTTTEAVTTTSTGKGTTTTTRLFPTTSTTGPKKVCVINEIVCLRAELSFKRVGKLVIYPRLD